MGDVDSAVGPREAKDGAEAMPGGPKPVVAREVDAAVEMTFPGSDAVTATPEAGLRVEVDVLREPIACSMAVRRMVAAGLQAGSACKPAMLARLQQVNPVCSAPRGGLDRLRAEGEAQLVRLQRALAAFGQSAERRVAGTAPSARFLRGPAGWRAADGHGVPASVAVV